MFLMLQIVLDKSNVVVTVTFSVDARDTFRKKETKYNVLSKSNQSELIHPCFPCYRLPYRVVTVTLT